MKLFDSHCHLDFEPLSTEMEDVIERAYKAGVTGMINVGASMSGSEKSVAIANNYPNIWASVGLHPHEAETILDLESTVDKLRELARNDKVVAIGEIGLDYYDPSTKQQISNIKKEKQIELFSKQLELAKELKLPIIFHVRDAWDDFFKIVSSIKYQVSRGVVHCFTGDDKIAKKLVNMGFYVGFTGFVTFEQSKFEHIREAVSVVPLNRLLIETDAPFLAPEPHRGKTNEPAYVAEIAKKIAQLKNIPTTELAEYTIKNTKKLFNIS